MADGQKGVDERDFLTPDVIRALRGRMGGLSQAAFAARLGVHPMTVSKWERGKDRRAPRGLYKAALLRLIEEHPLPDEEASASRHGRGEWET